jgi:O-antigen ligase
MEGVYFFGEHLRWNLGWENPNQAGAFVAMVIPWLWAWGRIACRNGAVPVEKWLTLAFEMGLWFLLCKTYSRGALVAVVCVGLLEAGRQFWLAKRKNEGARASRMVNWLRISGVGLILAGTGLFSRIDPRYVSQDASAGNRLTLWKGGAQMIAASPWEGWGKGESGPGFMHWFQPLDAHESYAGMVNSYLHIGVEYGLPILTGLWRRDCGFGSWLGIRP